VAPSTEPHGEGAGHDATGAVAALFADGQVLTVPNVITLVRLCCIPIFLWLLFGSDNQAAAAFLLGGLGATDWVDGWYARRYGAVSELGKVLDPTADRVMFIVAITAIIIDGCAPVWFCWLVVIREVAVGLTMLICYLFLGMSRFDVTFWGKLATFLLMFAIPGFMLGSSDVWAHDAFQAAAWILGIPGLILSYYTAFAYAPMVRAHLHTRRNARREVTT
jgi:cardiolipin synthase (CMP-forming)